MHWQYTPYAPPLLIAAVVSFALAHLAWRRRPAAGAATLAGLMLGVAVWSLAYAVELLCASLVCKLFWLKVEYLAIVPLPVLWLVLALRYTGRGTWLARRCQALLAVVPALTLFQIWTNENHYLFYGSASLDTSGAFALLDARYGPGFWLHVAYSYLLLAWGSLLFIRFSWRAEPLYRGQARVVLLGVLAPWLANALHLLHLTPFSHLDPTPFAFMLTGVALLWGLFRYRLLAILPVARDRLVEVMRDGVIVLDAQNRVVDLNPAARRMMARRRGDHPGDGLIGRPADEAFSAWPGLVARYSDVTETQEESVVHQLPANSDGARQHLAVRISPLQDRQGRLVGRLIVLRDVTRQAQAEQALARRVEFERLLTALSTRFINLPSSELDPAIERTLQAVGAFAGVDRSYVFVLRQDGALADNTHEWCAEGVAPQSERLQGLPVARFPWWMDRLRRFEHIHIPRLSTLPPEAGAEKALLQAQDIQSLIAIPLVCSGLLIGFLGLDTVRSEKSWSEETVALLRLAGDAIASALERQRIETALHERERFLALLNDITVAALQTPDLDTMLQTLAGQLAQLFGAEGCYITLWDEATQTPRRGAAFALSHETCRTLQVQAGEATLTAAVLREARPIAVPDSLHTPYISPRLAEQFPARSLLGLPLTAGDQKLGAVLITFDATHDFGPADIARGEQAAAQIALALAKARRLEGEREQRLRAEVLAQLTLALTSQTDYGAVLDEVLRHAQRLVPHRAAHIALLEGDALRIVRRQGDDARTVAGEPADDDPPQPLASRPLEAQVLSSGEPRVVANTRDEPDWVASEATAWVRSCLVVPIRLRDRTLGLLQLYSQVPEGLTTRDARRLQPLAGAAAIALENAQLFAEAQRRTVELETLRNTALRLTSSLELSDVLDGIAESALRLVEAEDCHLYLYDAATGQFTKGAALWRDGSRDPAVATPRPDGFTARVAREGRVIVINDAAQHPLFTTPQARAWNIQSIAGFPLQRAGRGIGVFTVTFVQPHHFGEDELRVLALLADQAVIALENARLFQTAGRQMQELAALYEVARATSGALETDLLLERLYDQVHQLLAPDTFVVVLYDAASHGYQVVLAEEQGQSVPGAVGMSLSLQGSGLMAWVLRERQSLLVGDLARDPLPADPIHGARPARSWLGVPLVLRDRLLGAISLQSFRPHAFGEADRRFLESLSAQVAIAIEDARLYQQAQQEIAERKRAEEALRHRVEEMAALYATSLDITRTHDLGTLLQIIIERAARLLGATAGGLYLCDPARQLVRCVVNYKIWPDYTGQELPYGVGAAGTVARTGEPLIIDDYRTWSGRASVFEADQPFRAVLSAPMTWQGAVTGVIHVLHQSESGRFTPADLDLLMLFANQAAIAVETARLVEGLEAEVAARTAEIEAEREKSETILRSVGDAIATVDRALYVEYVNDAFTALTGFTAGEIQGQDLPVVVNHPALQVARRRLAEGKTWQGEVTVRCKDGQTYAAALTMAPLRDAAGDLVGYVSSHRDISKLKELDRARQQFIANVSHELRTPVTNLKLYTHLLRTAAGPERSVHYQQVLAEQVEQLGNLVQDILEVTALDGGRGAPAWQSISLPSVIEQAAGPYYRQVEAAGLTLAVAPLPPDLPAVEGDAYRLAQALAQLVKNAITFTPSGGRVTIEAGTAEMERQPWVTLAVHDTGPGIASHEQSQIFERFFRGSLADSGHIPGSGLGLSIAQQIMRTLGGRVTVDSPATRQEAGQTEAGSTFTLWLPAVPGTALDVRREA